MSVDSLTPHLMRFIFSPKSYGIRMITNIICKSTTFYFNDVRADLMRGQEGHAP